MTIKSGAVWLTIIIIVAVALWIGIQVAVNNPVI